MKKNEIYFDAEASEKIKKDLNPAVEVLNGVGHEVMTYFPRVKWETHPAECAKILHNNPAIGVYLQREIIKGSYREEDLPIPEFLTKGPIPEDIRTLLIIQVGNRFKNIARFSNSSHYLMNNKHSHEDIHIARLIDSGAISFNIGVAYVSDNSDNIIDEYCTYYESSNKERDFIIGYKKLISDLNTVLHESEEMCKVLLPDIRSVQSLSSELIGPNPFPVLNENTDADIYRLVNTYFGKTHTHRDRSLFKITPRYTDEEVFSYTGYKLEDPTFLDYLNHPTLYNRILPPTAAERDYYKDRLESLK